LLDGKVCPHLRHSLRAYLQSCLTRAIQHVNDVRHAVREGNTVELGEAPQLTVQPNAIADNPALWRRRAEKAWLSRTKHDTAGLPLNVFSVSVRSIVANARWASLLA
jgi:hypothetical protein